MNPTRMENERVQIDLRIDRRTPESNRVARSLRVHEDLVGRKEKAIAIVYHVIEAEPQNASEGTVSL